MIASLRNGARLYLRFGAAVASLLGCGSLIRVPFWKLPPRNVTFHTVVFQERDTLLAIETMPFQFKRLDWTSFFFL